MPRNFFSLSTIAEYPQEDWGLVFSTVFTGLIVVFLILIILVALLYITGILFNKSKINDKKEEAPVRAKPVNVAPVQKSQTKPAENQLAVIAAITAAVEAYGEEQGKKLVVTGIRKREKTTRSAWSRAGVSENTGNFFR